MAIQTLEQAPYQPTPRLRPTGIVANHLLLRETVARTEPASPPTLESKIQEKVDATNDWIYQKYGPDYHALFLMDAMIWQHASPEVQEFAGAAMATILEATYPPHGQSYPLPEFIGKEFNTKVIASGDVLPYFGFIAPKELTVEMVSANPELLLQFREHLQPVGVSARVVSEDGSDELGRSAKMPGYEGFHAGALILQSQLDWLTQASSHVVRAEVRASAPHQAIDGSWIPSSGATQKLFFGELGLAPTRFIPGAYVLRDAEPFVIGERHREGTWKENLTKYPTIYTPAGNHINFLEAISTYQLGEPIQIVTAVKNTKQPYRHSERPQEHGDTVYAKVEVLSPGKAGKAESNSHDLLATLSKLDTSAPMVVVKVEAHTMEGAATQKLLLDNDFIVCGFEPAHTLPANGTRRGKQLIPPTIYMARHGKAVRLGEVRVSPAYFPAELYGPELQQEFRRIDAEFRQRIAA